MKAIFIEEIFKTELSIMDAEYPEMAAHVRRKIKETIETVLDNAAESACVLLTKKSKTYFEQNKKFVTNGGDTYFVDKDSILDIKNLIDYKTKFPDNEDR